VAGISATDIGLLIIRLVLAAVFIYHGSQKLGIDRMLGAQGGHGIAGFAGYLESLGVPMPKVAAWVAALTEFIGGIVLVIGTGTRIVAIPMMCVMIVAIWKVHFRSFSLPDGMEYALTLGCVLLGLALIGPGKLTVGRLFGGK
jgi:putative oxidoreductase